MMMMMMMMMMMTLSSYDSFLLHRSEFIFQSSIWGYEEGLTFPVEKASLNKPKI
jgi:hypothetical protein